MAIVNVDVSALPGVPYQPVDAYRADAGTLFTAQDLEFLESNVLADEYTPLEGDDLVATVSNVPGWNKTIRQKRSLVAGEPAWIGVGGRQTDIPQIDQSVTDETWNQNKIAIGATWDDDEIAAARAMGGNLDPTSATEAVTALNTKLDNFKFSGALDIGMKGFADDSLVPQSESPVGFNSNFTALAILNAMHDAVNGVAERTNRTEAPNRLCLPIKAFHYISTTPMSADNSTFIIDVFVASNPYISNKSQIYPMVKLADFPNGPSMVVTNFNPAKAKVNQIAPSARQVQQVGLMFIVIYVAYSSEVMHLRPHATAIQFNTDRQS